MDHFLQVCGFHHNHIYGFSIEDRYDKGAHFLQIWYLEYLEIVHFSALTIISKTENWKPATLKFNSTCKSVFESSCSTRRIFQLNFHHHLYFIQMIHREMVVSLKCFRPNFTFRKFAIWLFTLYVMKGQNMLGGFESYVESKSRYSQYAFPSDDYTLHNSKFIRKVVKISGIRSHKIETVYIQIRLVDITYMTNNLSSGSIFSLNKIKTK